MSSRTSFRTQVLATVAAGVLNASFGSSSAAETPGVPPLRAPFEKLDSLCVNDWWNRSPSPIMELRPPRTDVIAFALYTVSEKTLKLTAQFYPLYPMESRTASLEILRDGTWTKAADAQIHDLGWSAHFRLGSWDDANDVPYRVVYEGAKPYEGLVRKNPRGKKEIVLAALSCNSNKDRGDRRNYVRNINAQDPDLIFFAGDQSYDHQQHTAAWLRFGWQFRETFRNRPCITIPDDHDIGQGNLWGEGGKKASSQAGNDGGYFFHPEYVNMVERCQTWHLPDPYDPAPVEQGIGVYYTSLRLGDVDLAIIEDRKFKSGPKGKIPQRGPRPDHINDPNYDPKSIDVPGLHLLGDRQLKFLQDWGKRRENAALKAVLSQTGFVGAAHVHGKPDNRLFADLDSNGWPQTGRRQALRAIRAAGAVHIGGDQHLATVLQHGIDEFRDGPWAFVVPAIVNNYYSRWWMPEDGQPGENRPPDSPLPWTGDYRDGFGNRLTMHAYANPDSPSHGAGYGLIRFDAGDKEVTFECWPRNADVASGKAKQFPGWPITVKMQ